MLSGDFLHVIAQASFLLRKLLHEGYALPTSLPGFRAPPSFRIDVHGSLEMVSYIGSALRRSQYLCARYFGMNASVPRSYDTIYRLMMHRAA